MTADDRAWLYREFEKLGEHTERVERVVREQNSRVGKAETRLTVIETEREAEEKQAIRRGTWAGIVAAAGLTGLIEVLKVWARR